MLNFCDLIQVFLFIDIVNNDFRLLKGTLVTNEDTLNSLIRIYFHAPTFQGNQTDQPVHMCKHKNA